MATDPPPIHTCAVAGKGDCPACPPPHTGLRPLSLYGEGYCRWCHFVVGLDHYGLLVRHFRGGSGDELRGPRGCKGSGTKPPKVTPYMSRKAMFKTVGRKERCHVCNREVPLLPDGRMTSHTPDPYRPTWHCKGGYQVPGRDHGGERG